MMLGSGAFCFPCCKALKAGKGKLSGSAKPAFLVNGFTNWKDATRNFSKHVSCDRLSLVLSSLNGDDA